jgi:hypothetical protein
LDYALRKPPTCVRKSAVQKIVSRGPQRHEGGGRGAAVSLREKLPLEFKKLGQVDECQHG